MRRKNRWRSDKDKKTPFITVIIKMSDFFFFLWKLLLYLNKNVINFAEKAIILLHNIKGKVT